MFKKPFLNCHDLAFLGLSRTLSFAQFAPLIAAQTHPRVSDKTTNDRGYYERHCCLVVPQAPIKLHIIARVILNP
jgi:hypothetical protein